MIAFTQIDEYDPRVGANRVILDTEGVRFITDGGDQYVSNHAK